MNTDEVVKAYFEDIIKIEKKMEDEYIAIYEKLIDEDYKKKIEVLIKDEVGHQYIVEQVLDLLGKS